MEYLGGRWGTVCGRRQKMTWLREEERKQIFVKKRKEKRGSVLGEETGFNWGKRIKIRKRKRLIFSGDRKGTIMERRQGWKYRRKKRYSERRKRAEASGGAGEVEVSSRPRQP